MITNLNLISCNFFSPSLPSRLSKLTITHQTQTQTRNPKTLRSPSIIPFKFPPNFNSSSSKMGLFKKWRSASGSQTMGDPAAEKGSPVEGESGGGGNGGEGRDWTTSILLFVLWAGLMFYVFNLAPNQTPVFTWFGFSFLFVHLSSWSCLLSKFYLLFIYRFSYDKRVTIVVASMTLHILLRTHSTTNIEFKPHDADEYWLPFSDYRNIKFRWRKWNFLPWKGDGRGVGNNWNFLCLVVFVIWFVFQDNI